MRRWTMVLFLAVTAGLLASCGARGDLDPPPGSAQPNKDDPFILDRII